MSQTETNHLTVETSATVMNGRLIGESSRVFSKPGSGLQIAEEDHHPLCEEAWLCAQFLVRLSYQMRTRLNSIVGVAEMMHEADLSESQKEFVDTIADSANALASMTDAIADFTRCLALGAGLHAHQSELTGNGSEGIDHGSSGNGPNAIAHPIASGRGVEDMLSKTPAGARRTFNSAANFRTRVPPDTAKLIRILVAEDHLMNQHEYFWSGTARQANFTQLNQ
jgi:hypothetical protein